MKTALLLCVIQSKKIKWCPSQQTDYEQKHEVIKRNELFDIPCANIRMKKASYKDYRGLGIGTALMTEMLRILKDRGYKQVSLAVQKANYAVKMYHALSFVIIQFQLFEE